MEGVNKAQNSTKQLLSRDNSSYGSGGNDTTLLDNKDHLPPLTQKESRVAEKWGNEWRNKVKNNSKSNSNNFRRNSNLEWGNGVTTNRRITRENALKMHRTNVLKLRAIGAIIPTNSIFEDQGDGNGKSISNRKKYEEFYKNYNINLTNLFIKPYLIGSTIILLTSLVILIMILNKFKIFFKWTEDTRIAHIFLLFISISLFLVSLIIFSVFIHAAAFKTKNTIATTFVHATTKSLFGALTETEAETEAEVVEQIMDKSQKTDQKFDEQKLSKQTKDIVNGSLSMAAVIIIINLFYKYQYTNERYSLFIGSVMPCLLIGVLIFISLYSILYEFMEDYYESKIDDISSNKQKKKAIIDFAKKRSENKEEAKRGILDHVSNKHDFNIDNFNIENFNKDNNENYDPSIEMLVSIYINEKKYQMFKISAIVSVIFFIISTLSTALFFAFCPIANLVESKNYWIQSVLGTLSIICGMSITNFIISIGRFLTIAVNLDLDCDSYIILNDIQFTNSRGSFASSHQSSTENSDISHYLSNATGALADVQEQNTLLTTPL